MSEEKEEDEYERRFREIEEKAKLIRDKISAPELPEIEFTRPIETPTLRPEKKSLASNSERSLGIAFAIGYSFVGPLIAGIVIGAIIDGHVGGTWTIVGIFVGTVMAFVLLIRLVIRLNENQP